MGATTCQQKKKLFDAYRNATGAHAESLSDLQRKMGTSSKSTYDALYRKTETLGNAASKAKEALDRHVTAHEC
jgi:hypothetical protein